MVSQISIISILAMVVGVNALQTEFASFSASTSKEIAISLDFLVTGKGALHSRNFGGLDAWGELDQLTTLGSGPVAIDGDIIVFGAFNENTLTGAAYVYGRNVTGTGDWVYMTRLEASDAQGRDEFGFSVAIDGDVILIGAPSGSAVVPKGSAYVYGRNVNGTDAWGQVTKIMASDAEDYDNFGYSVGVSGDTMVVGAMLKNSEAGAAYVFGRNVNGTDAWGQVAKIVASDAQGIEQPSGYGDLFGRSAAIQGDIIVIGASGEGDSVSNAGAAYMYGRNVNGPDTWGEITKLVASERQAFGVLGWSVAMDADKIVVGGRWSDSVLVFGRDVNGPNAWGEQARLAPADGPGMGIGGSVDVSGEYIVARSEAGDVYLFTICGDGVVAGPEEVCDDSNLLNNDGCDANCYEEVCGNGVTQSHLGEECDDGNTDNFDGCDSNCYNEVCGNEVVQPHLGEECDDGGIIDGDGCNFNCTIEYCGDGTPNNNGEECDDGGLVDGDGCDSNCYNEVCGNGRPQFGEECDDGNTNDNDGCNFNCTIEYCGDGTPNNNGEECDDGGLVNGDGCDSDCYEEVCGNGVVQSHLGEECDDGNEDVWDGCHSCATRMSGASVSIVAFVSAATLAAAGYVGCAVGTPSHSPQLKTSPQSLEGALKSPTSDTPALESVKVAEEKP